VGVLNEFMNTCEEVHAAVLGVYRALRFITDPNVLDDELLQVIYEDLWYYGAGIVAVLTLPALLVAAAVGLTWEFSAGLFAGIIVWCALYIWSRGQESFFPTRKVAIVTERSI